MTVDPQQDALTQAPHTTGSDVRRVTTAAGMPHSYIVRGDALGFGASLGNAHSWMTTRANGSIQDVFNTDIGVSVAGAVVVRYGAVGTHLVHDIRPSSTMNGSLGDVQLWPVDPGTIELHPAYQRHSFPLSDALQIEETVFLPMVTGDDATIAYYQIAITNGDSVAHTVRVYAFAHLCGGLGSDVTARYDESIHALVVANRAQPDAVRVFGCTTPAATYDTSHDFGRAYDLLHAPTLGNDTSATGDIMGALQVDVTLGPRERHSLAFVLAFAHTGDVDAIATYKGALDVDAALQGTIDYVTRVTSVSQVLTPLESINTGALWSKVNMLRVMARYPQGWAFTNEPGVSSAVVGRDVAWFVFGNDHFQPDFSRNLLNAFAERQYADGRIPEYYHAVTNHIDDYGLNINDDTPLFIMAVNHHYRSTGDLTWLKDIYPAVVKAARYIVTQEDERGLVFCTAKDPRGNVWAIAGWRNVIPDYTLNGAVTEINAECTAALRVVGHLAQNLGRPPEEEREFFAASDRLREAMDKHLINPRNGLYYLNIDADGVVHTDITGDEIFPVMLRVCSDDVGFRVIRRLNHADFWTSAGLRTASSEDPLYNPMRNVGLIGGVWPGLTWWYAFAAARYHPDLMVHALAASFEHYASDPRKNTTVPGQFSEWFDGESLVNRGMRLSPWEPPRFLWAAVEGVCGLVLQPGAPKINPLVPVSWRWVALRRAPYHALELSFFATREQEGDPAAPFHIYATMEVDTDHTLDVYKEDVTNVVRVRNPNVCHVALRRDEEAVLFVGNTHSGSTIVPVELGELLDADTQYDTRIYDSESQTWRQADPHKGSALSTCAIPIAAGGFSVLRFVRRQEPATVT